MNTPAFSTVRTARTQFEADLYISVLQNAGLHPLELETFGHVSLAGAEADYTVRVPTDEVARAREVLSAQDSGTE